METKKAPQIPYGISDFVRMRTENYYYVDKTMYLPMIEDFPHPWRHAHLSDICSTQLYLYDTSAPFRKKPFPKHNESLL